MAPTYVVGLEADIQGLSGSNKSFSLTSATPNPVFPGFPVNQVATVTSRLDYLGTVRGRVGYLFTPSFLAYATGGFAYGGVHDSTNIAQNVIAAPLTPYAGASTFSGTRGGWTIGGGFEWMCAQNWSVKAEYLYVDLGTATNTTPLVNPDNIGGIFSSATAISSVHVTDNIVRAGINYHFH